MNYVMQVYRNYAVFEGRARRREYWSFFAFFAAVMVVASLLANHQGSVLEIIVSLLLGLFALASFVPALAVRVRRLHDIDKSGFWILIAFLPILGELVLFIFCVLPGTNGANRYGPDPKAIGGDASFVFS